MEHAPFCPRVKRQPDQLIDLDAGAATALRDMLCYEGFTSQPQGPLLYQM